MTTNVKKTDENNIASEGTEAKTTELGLDDLSAVSGGAAAPAYDPSSAGRANSVPENRFGGDGRANSVPNDPSHGVLPLPHAPPHQKGFFRTFFKRSS